MTEEAGTDFHIWGPCNSRQGCCTVLRERLRSGSHIPASAGQDIPLHGIHILHVLRNVGRTGPECNGTGERRRSDGGPGFQGDSSLWREGVRGWRETSP